LLRSQKHFETFGKLAASSTVERLSNRPDQIPLSYSQERLWFIDQFEGSVEYHTPAALRLIGHLNREALEAAFHSIVDRHEVLRTVFKEAGGRPFQAIHDSKGWRLSVIDGRKYKQDRRGLQSYIEGLVRAPFNLSSDYMLRADLINLDEEEHVLVGNDASYSF
jgi:hypothetical protein